MSMVKSQLCPQKVIIPFARGPLFFGDKLLAFRGHLHSLQDLFRIMDREKELFDRLTLQMCDDERKQGNRLSPELLRAEMSAWLRQKRASTR